MSGESSVRCGAQARRVLVPLLLFAAAFGGSTASAQQAQKGVVNPAPAETQTAYTAITSSSGPLNEIDIGNDLAAQIAHVGDSSGEVYPPGTKPGDYGTFLLINGTLYSSDFNNHGGLRFNTFADNSALRGLSLIDSGNSAVTLVGASGMLIVGNFIGVGTNGVPTSSTTL